MKAMNHNKNLQEQETIHPIVVWILASILFHLLLTLCIITLKARKLQLNDLKKPKQEQAILMMEPPKQKPITTLARPAKPAPSKPEPKKAQAPKTRHWSEYTLVPGSQGVNKQNIENPQDLSNLPTPKNQMLQPKQDQKKSEQSASDQQELIKPSQKSLPKEQPKEAQKIIDETLHGKAIAKPIEQKQPKSTALDNRTGNNDSEILSRKKTPLKEQNPYDFVPQPKRLISFQDTKLGFDNSVPTIGNNPHLIQQGRTFETPDAVSLKHLTYYNQCAEMMKTAIATHPQRHLRVYPTGKRFLFAITVDRTGRQLSLSVVQGSGDSILDRILIESVQSIALFPQIPNFIEDNPFTMRWTFLH